MLTKAGRARGVGQRKAITETEFVLSVNTGLRGVSVMSGPIAHVGFRRPRSLGAGHCSEDALVR
jgi:hypothetical protein